MKVYIFTAPWCNSCKRINKDNMTEISLDEGVKDQYIVNVLGITKFPTLIMYDNERDMNEIDRFISSDNNDIQLWIEYHENGEEYK